MSWIFFMCRFMFVEPQKSPSRLTHFETVSCYQLMDGFFSCNLCSKVFKTITNMVDLDVTLMTYHCTIFTNPGTMYNRDVCHMTNHMTSPLHRFSPSLGALHPFKSPSLFRSPFPHLGILPHFRSHFHVYGKNFASHILGQNINKSEFPEKNKG